MKNLLVHMVVSDTFDGAITLPIMIDVEDDATENEIHEQAYLAFKELCIDVDSYEEIE